MGGGELSNELIVFDPFDSSKNYYDDGNRAICSKAEVLVHAGKRKLRVLCLILFVRYGGWGGKGKDTRFAEVLNTPVLTAPITFLIVLFRPT